jgi:hypothetical protein
MSSSEGLHPQGAGAPARFASAVRHRANLGADLWADLSLQQAETARAAGVETNRWDQDIQDPMGLSFDAYRAISWEIVEWCDRLVAGLYG